MAGEICRLLVGWIDLLQQDEIGLIEVALGHGSHGGHEALLDIPVACIGVLGKQDMKTLITLDFSQTFDQLGPRQRQGHSGLTAHGVP